MEDEIVKKIAELLGSETGIETEKVYNHIQEGLKKREAEKQTDAKKSLFRNKVAQACQTVGNISFPTIGGLFSPCFFHIADSCFKKSGRKKAGAVGNQHRQNSEGFIQEGRHRHHHIGDGLQGTGNRIGFGIISVGNKHGVKAIERHQIGAVDDADDKGHRGQQGKAEKSKNDQ